MQPTSEEAVTDIARLEIRAIANCPLNFYHIKPNSATSAARALV